MNTTRANELKQAGAIEAARDPDSAVTSQGAQRKIVQESQKAGAAAFQFDPDATPEEKAAQARARLPDGFHSDRKPKALGIVSDADDSNTGQKYELPTPTKAGALSVPESPTQAKAANGSAGDDQRWARDRVGWAPRFGSGDPADDEGQTLLEHQSWLEGKLDEKWYGDWYYNAGIIIFACLATHISTILGGGLSGMFIILAFCATYYRTSLRRVRRNFRDDIRRELAKTALEHDHESLEWINSFMVKFWPIYAPVLCDTIISSVDQVLSTTTPAILDSMRMKTFTLGTKPPRMEHVKTYPKTEEDTVLMDWKFSFNPNDTADLTARQLKNKINPKVVLEIRVGKGLVSKGLDVIVEDFAFSGTMRLKFKLQIPFPHIEKVEMCFLGRPEIDYVCKPLGGDMFGFDINIIPGLEGFIQEQIHGNLAPIMYEPNVFPIEIAKMLAGNPVDQAIGVVQVTLHGAEGLKNPDKFPGIPDPYANVSINGRDVLAKTKTVKENSNPRWGQTFNVIVTSLADVLHMQVYDWNEFRKDKDLGTATFALDRLQSESVHENMHIEVMANGKARGVIQADIRFFPVLEGEKLVDGTQAVPESNTGIARFTIEQAKDLDGTKNMTGQLNPYAILLLNGREVHSSAVRKRTNNPIWDNAYKELLITDRKNARLGVVIKDDHEIGGHPIVGTYQVKLDDMIELMSKGQEWYNLAGVKTGRAKMMLQWKPVALKGVAGGSGGYVTPIGVMRFHFKNARDLRNLETMGKSDPYVRVLLSGIEKGRTVTFQNNLNPDFDEIIYVPVHNTREKLTLEVMDSENTQSDRSLGSIELTSGDYISQNEEGEYLAHDEKAPQSATLRLPGREPKGKLNYTAAFYPTYNVQDPEEEAHEKEAAANGGPRASTESARGTHSRTASAESIEGVRSARSGTISSLKPADKELAKELAKNEREQGETKELQVKQPPKIKITADDLTHYESGLIVFKLLDADLARSNCYVEILMDDMLFPAYRSSRVRSKQTTFNEIGDAIVRELDMSRITIRIKEKIDRKGEGSDEHVYAKLTGQTLDVLRAGLYKTYNLNLKGEDGRANHLTVQLKYLPIKMQLDPGESINNMGTLRVDVHDAADLPAADRNGLSDPYLKFLLNGKQVHKTEVQKKTLHPSWNETFETKIASRTAAQFKLECWDWDRGGGDDHLGSADINLDLLEPFQAQEVVLGLDGKSGSVRLKLLFKPDYVTRARQGSSTFQGTFAVPGKVIGAPVKGVGKGAVFVGGNVVRGATFVGGNVGKVFRRKKTNGEEEEIVEPTDESTANSSAAPSISYPPSSATRAAALESMPPSTPQSGHMRSPSAGGASLSPSMAGHGSGEQGTATFTLLSAQGYEGKDVRVTVKQLGPKGPKEVHKSKAHKMSAGEAATFDEHAETFQVKCTADTQFKVQVKNHHTLGSDDELGEGLLVVADTPGGGSKEVHAGQGTLIFKTSFKAIETGSLLSTSNSPAGKSRRSFFGSGRGRSVSGAAGGDNN